MGNVKIYDTERSQNGDAMMIIFAGTEAKEKNGQQLVKVPEKGLLSLIAAKLKDRALFP